MGRILDAAKAYFDGIGWVYTVADEATALEFEFAGDWGLWRVVVLEREGADQVVVYSMIPVEASEDTMPAAYELVARINHGLGVGCFEVGPRSGQIRFRNGIDFGDTEPSPGLIGAAIRLNLRTTDRYVRAFAPVLVEGHPPGPIVDGLERT